MIWQNFQYRWLDLSNSTQKTQWDTLWYWIVLQSEVHTTDLSTDIFENANYHWWYTSATLAWPRLWTFSWKIMWTNKSNRDKARSDLVAVIQPDANPWSLNRWFYTLNFQDWQWNDRRVNAKVYKAPEPSFWNPCDTSFDFTFELITESEKIYWEYKTSTWWIATVWGMTLPTTLPTTLTWYAGTISCTNSWNRSAPVRISVVGSITNPKIINTTNSQKYRIDKTTTNLVFDNTNQTNDPRKRLVVTDSGTGITGYRNSGSSVYLDPGENKIAVIGDSYDASTTVTINFYDTYLY